MLLILMSFCLTFCFVYIKYILYANKGDGRIVGPPPYPIIGNAMLFVNKPPQDFLKIVDKLVGDYGNTFKLFLPNLVYVISDPEDVKVVLSQNEFSTKSDEYKYLQPWLGLGLLTSSGERWKQHRKVITPSFHFKILENYLETMHRQTDILIQKLSSKCDGKTFDVYKYLTLSALDIICETSMGCSINAQMDSESEYVKAVEGISQLMVIRMKHVWKKNDIIYRFCNDYKLHQKYIKILHNFTDTVIQQRKLTLNNNDELLENFMEDTNIYGEKRKIAFLDLLLLTKIDGEPLSDVDIREEVDTFMFEGHDTVSSAMGFALYELSKHLDVQDKLYEEQKNIFADGKTELPTHSNLQEMKYLEMVIKETLRLFPSVPFLGRTVSKDTKIRDIFVPKDTSIVVYTMATHRDPNYFPEPEKFIPERFSTEASNKQNPFSSIAFSAGPRNCIGQKFALFEMKMTLGKIVRNFIIEPTGFKPTLLGDLVLKPMKGIKIKLRKR